MQPVTRKPRFPGLRAALAFIRDELPLLRERTLWQDMQQRDLDNGGGWDA